MRSSLKFVENPSEKGIAKGHFLFFIGLPFLRSRQTTSSSRSDYKWLSQLKDHFPGTLVLSAPDPPETDRAVEPEWLLRLRCDRRLSGRQPPLQAAKRSAAVSPIGTISAARRCGRREATDPS